MSTREERTQRLGEIGDRAQAAADRMNALPSSKRYAKRKALYQRGSVYAVPLDSVFGGTDGTWGLMVIQSCSWLGNVYYYFMDVWVDELPDPSDLARLLSPTLVSELWHTGDSMLHSGEFINVGVLEDLATWPVPVSMWTAETRGPTVTRLSARKLMPEITDSPDVAGFLESAVPAPWIEVRRPGLGSFPIARLSNMQHLRTPVAEFGTGR